MHQVHLLPLLHHLLPQRGCAEGWGYYIDDPDAICELLDKIGEGPPQDVRFCAVLGCPYNPSNLPSPSSDQEDENQKRRTEGEQQRQL